MDKARLAVVAQMSHLFHSFDMYIINIYYTKKHRGGCTMGSLRSGPIITKRARGVRLVIVG